jgi:N-acetyl-anhydromuramoyl-L-alanine amidase
MPFPEITRLSPHCDIAPAHERLGVLFHHSVMPFKETIEFMLRPESKVSYHCLIDSDGTRCTLVADEHVAWHAGASSFLGRSRCNDFLLGLAFAGDTYRTPLTPAQLASALEWLAPRCAAHGWTSAQMTDHRQASPQRKDDLNPVEWLRLQSALHQRFGPQIENRARPNASPPSSQL